MSSIYNSTNAFLPVEELRNVFTEARRKFDEEVWPSDDPVGDRAYVMSFIDGLEAELQKRSQANLENALKRNAIAVKQDEMAKARAQAESDKNRDEWLKRTRMGREWSTKS